MTAPHDVDILQEQAQQQPHETPCRRREVCPNVQPWQGENHQERHDIRCQQGNHRRLRKHRVIHHAVQGPEAHHPEA